MEGTSSPSEATPTSSQDTWLPGDATVLGVFDSLDQSLSRCVPPRLRADHRRSSRVTASLAWAN